MKTYTTPLDQRQSLQTATRPATAKRLVELLALSARDIVALSVATLAAAAVITLSIWLAAQGASPVPGALTWGLGFIFFALAVNSDSRPAIWRMATAVALSGLALLQDRVSPDFLIVAGVLLAAWVAHTIWKKRAVQEA
ncbi:MAG: hypothetical protein WBS20_13540 [Lysobacterales bacterium]